MSTVADSLAQASDQVVATSSTGPPGWAVVFMIVVGLIVILIEHLPSFFIED